MTHAQAANRETCAGPGCHQPAEAYLPHTTDKGTVSLGYCLDCIPRLPAILPPAPAEVAEQPQRRKRRKGR